MKWLNDLSINCKIGVGFSLMIIFMGVIGFVGYMNVRNTQHNLDEILQIKEINLNTSEQAKEKISSSNRETIIFLLCITGIGVLIAIASAVILSRNILTRVHENIRMLKYISRGDGDLTKRLSVNSRDEVGELAIGFNTFMGKIQHIISTIAEDSDTIASSSEELSATAEELRRGADDQALNIEQSATTMNEISQTIMDVAQNSFAASEATKEASEIASAGKKVVEESVESISNISKTVETSAKTIYGLGESSQQIEEIIMVIKDIAEQTNLLALNAAIEAARAGEQGRGFAVVADEVRKLAERTGNSTGEISQKIEKIQKDINISVKSIEDGKAQVEEGVKLSVKARESLEGIVEATDKCYNMVQMIATATEEQSSAVDVVSSTMDNIQTGSITSQQKYSQISDATSDLAKLASVLHEIVARFKTHSTAEHISDQETSSQSSENEFNVSGSRKELA